MKQWTPPLWEDDPQRGAGQGRCALPQPVGKTQYFELEPFTHWPGNETEEVTPGDWRLFKCGPNA